MAITTATVALSPVWPTRGPAIRSPAARTTPTQASVTSSVAGRPGATGKAAENAHAKAATSVSRASERTSGGAAAATRRGVLIPRRPTRSAG
jgi:hypothetical protein